MKRRSFLKKFGAAAAASAVAAPALAQSQPEIKWRLASSFPKSLDTLFGAGEQVAKRVAAATNNKFQIRVFAAGEIVPGLQVLDAVKDGTVEMGHSASSYYVGKEAALTFDTTLPFGLNTRQQNAWMYEAGGLALTRELFREFNIYNIPLGNTTAQMGGWYRKEIKSVNDMKGLKMRIAGIAGQVMQRVGAVPQQIAAGEVYSALERGTIDATEFVGPYDDEKLGFGKVAKFYYYPGWHEGNAQLTAFVGQRQWESLPKDYQAILEMACAEAHQDMIAKYDARNAAALKRLVASGTQLRAFPKTVLQALQDASFALYDELAAKNPKFKKIYDHWSQFRAEQHLWFRVAEQGFDNFVYSAGTPKKKKE